MCGLSIIDTCILITEIRKVPFEACISCLDLSCLVIADFLLISLRQSYIFIWPAHLVNECHNPSYHCPRNTMTLAKVMVPFPFIVCKHLDPQYVIYELHDTIAPPLPPPKKMTSCSDNLKHLVSLIHTNFVQIFININYLRGRIAIYIHSSHASELIIPHKGSNV